MLLLCQMIEKAGKTGRQVDKMRFNSVTFFCFTAFLWLKQVIAPMRKKRATNMTQKLVGYGGSHERKRVCPYEPNPPVSGPPVPTVTMRRMRGCQPATIRCLYRLVRT